MASRSPCPSPASLAAGPDATQHSSQHGSAEHPLTPGHRPIAMRNASVSRDSDADKALRRRISLGLPKVRRYIDPNQIEICIPPGFLPASPPQIRSADRTHSLCNLNINPEVTGLAPGSSDYGSSSHSARARAVERDHDSALALARLVQLSPVTILATGRVDPLTNFPIKISKRDQWLIDQSKSQHLTPKSHCSLRI